MEPRLGTAVPSVSLIVPTYNEAENIQELIRRAYAAVSSATDDFEIVIVDDQSTDSTVALARAIAAEHDNVKVIERTGPRDLALSVIDGWNASRGELLAVIDGDLQHPPEVLPSLINLIAQTNADLGVASRHLSGGGVSDWKLHRRIVSWGATSIAGFLIPGVLRMVRDPMSGYFAVRRRVFEQEGLRPTGYKILLEVLARARYQTVVEVPYIFEERKRGVSKLGGRQVFQYLQHVFRLSRETGEIGLLLRYTAVGLSGIFVNGAISQLLPGLAGQALGFECSVLSNFMLNEFWTFSGPSRLLAMSQPRLKRGLYFQAISLASLCVNLGVSAFLSVVCGVHPQLAQFAGMAAAGFTNFFANIHLTWWFWKHEDIPLTGGAVERHKRLC